MKHKHYECIVAWAEGKQIQYLDEWNEKWADVKVPNWNSTVEFRIKPNLKKFRVALFKDNGATWSTHCTNDAQANGVEKSIRFSRWLTDWIEYEA